MLLNHTCELLLLQLSRLFIYHRQLSIPEYVPEYVPTIYTYNHTNLPVKLMGIFNRIDLSVWLLLEGTDIYAYRIWFDLWLFQCIH